MVYAIYAIFKGFSEKNLHSHFILKYFGRFDANSISHSQCILFYSILICFTGEEGEAVEEENSLTLDYWLDFLQEKLYLTGFSVINKELMGNLNVSTNIPSLYSRILKFNADKLYANWRRNTNTYKSREGLRSYLMHGIEINLDEMLKFKGRTFILIGEAGSGKTVTLKGLFKLSVKRKISLFVTLADLPETLSLSSLTLTRPGFFSP